MKYYIIKAKSVLNNEEMIEGIRSVDQEAEFVDEFVECDMAILQPGWTRSNAAVEVYKSAKNKHVKCIEGYNYIHKFSAHIN